MKQHRRIFTLVSALLLLTIVGFLLPGAAIPPAAAAGGTTYTVTSTDCTGPGSIAEAMALANANPGTDTITFTPGLQINAVTCPEANTERDYFAVHATESVIIEGNGAKLAGIIQWITTGGLNTPLDQCPTKLDVLVATSPGFIKVGLANRDNSAITVTVRNLDLQELNSVAQIEKNASLILEDLEVDTIISHYSAKCTQPAVLALEGANFTARRTQWAYITSFQDPPPRGPSLYQGAVFSSDPDAGNLTLEDSLFRRIPRSGMIWWNGQPGSEVNIVTSRFDNTVGFSIWGAATTNIVNTIWSSFSPPYSQAASRIYNRSSGEMNIVASTLLNFYNYCNSACKADGSRGLIYRWPGYGKINLVQSAIGVNFPYSFPPSDSVKVLDPSSTDPSPGFSADPYTWVQPTLIQDEDALKAVTSQQSLLTGSPALPTEVNLPMAQWATPLDPGELIDRVPNAECGLANQLLNPIDGSCITVDALGNPRVDANGMRNIGAVQLTLAPHLTVTGTGDQTVDLSWTKPRFSSPATGINGYELQYRETGTSSWTTVSFGPDTLTHQVTGLTNGTEYEFEVRATYSPSGEGPYSNNVTATPYGPIGTPVVTATPGNGEVALSWTLPDLGGRTFVAYTILWRVAGTDEYIGAQATYSPDATTTTVTGLKNGTEYEFAVAAKAGGDVGPQGLATATPFKPTQPPGNMNCTRTQGYWSTHSEYGPSLYDATWAQFPNGADTPFFLSGQSYYQAINADPEGNAYYILAQQYIAAELNFLHGADPADAQAAFDAATALFNAYTPTDIAGLAGDDPLRAQFIGLAYTLDQYNMGVTGPGYCTE